MVADGDRSTLQKYGSPLENGQLVSPDGETLANTKQEEWVTKKKTELTKTKQIETRVKRQVVLEDGKVVEDSGPLVTTTTTEDTDKQESEHTEKRAHGDDPDPKEGWLPALDEGVVKESVERKVTTHDELEDIFETEEVQHLGDISNESLVRAIRDGGDAREALIRRDRDGQLVPSGGVRQPQKRVVNKSKRHDRTTDIEDTNEVSRLRENGNIVTEISKRTEHEEFHNSDIPDDSDSEEYEAVEHRRGTRNYSHSRNEDAVDYYRLSDGVKVRNGGRQVSEEITSKREGDEDLWDSVSERMRRTGAEKGLNGRASTDITGALEKKSPDSEQSRKHDTHKWLDSHFGSSSSSLNSVEGGRTSRGASKDSGKKHISFRERSPKEDDRRRSDWAQQQRSSPSRGSTPNKWGWASSPHTPTPPPRNRRGTRNSPHDIRLLSSPDPSYPGIRSRSANKFYSERPSQSGDIGERRGYERREQSFGFDGPPDSFGRNSGYVTKHDNVYRTQETTNPGQNSLYENGEAEVTERKTVERREKNFNFSGPAQKQFHPKYIMGSRSSTMNRLSHLDMVEGSDPPPLSIGGGRSSTTPRRHFYFGENEGGRESATSHRSFESRSERYGTDDIGLSGGRYGSSNDDQRRASTLSRSFSFTPRSMASPARSSSSHRPLGDPHITHTRDLMSPRLINLLSRSVRDVSVTPHQETPYSSSATHSSSKNSRELFSNRYESGLSRSKQTFLDSLDTRNSPTRSTTPLRSVRPLGGATSPLSDETRETFRMSSSTPDWEPGKPKIKKDTTSTFSRKTIRGESGEPVGKIESHETKTRTKSRFSESEVNWPNGGKTYQSLNADGSVVIPAREP